MNYITQKGSFKMFLVLKWLSFVLKQINHFIITLNVFWKAGIKRKDQNLESWLSYKPFINLFLLSVIHPDTLFPTFFQKASSCIQLIFLNFSNVSSSSCHLIPPPSAVFCLPTITIVLAGKFKAFCRYKCNSKLLIQDLISLKRTHTEFISWLEQGEKWINFHFHLSFFKFDS